jgi:hypothetical protein
LGIAFKLRRRYALSGKEIRKSGIPVTGLKEVRMNTTQNRRLLCCGVAALGLLATSCNTGPAPPKPGTPAFDWAAAVEAHRIGDYSKTSQMLAKVTRTDNEFTARALPWGLVVSSGLARAFRELGDRYELGARANRANPTPFRRQVTTARGYASGEAMQFAETFHRFLDANKDPSVALVFSYPIGNVAEPPQLGKLAKGMLLQPADMESLQTAMVRRGVLMGSCLAVGAPDDPAKTLELFKKGDVQVPRDTFLTAMASSLYEESQLFGSSKLDQPNRAKLLLSEATAALKTVPPTKQTKELQKKVESTLKKIK